VGRIAAGIWAAIAFFGAITSVEPLRFPDARLTLMHALVLSAVTMAAITFVLPWDQMPRRLFTIALLLMSIHVSAFAYASGAVKSDLVMLLTLGVTLAVCFLPVKTSVAQVVMIAVLLGAGLVLLDKDNAGIAALRNTMLLAFLVVLCGLVLILRAIVGERDHQLLSEPFHTGLLDRRDLDRALEREVARAARHARPLSVVTLDVVGSLPDEAPQRHERLVANMARAILGRIRIEDTAAHLGGMCFAIVAPETTAAGAATIAEILSDVVRERLVTLGYDGTNLDVAAGFADYPHGARSRTELMRAAQAALDGAVVRAELGRVHGDHPTPSTQPAPAGPS
jgi:diguanylate cyclase (GGDEF)-like protein